MATLFKIFILLLLKQGLSGGKSGTYEMSTSYQASFPTFSTLILQGDQQILEEIFLTCSIFNDAESILRESHTSAGIITMRLTFRELSFSQKLHLIQQLERFRNRMSFNLYES